MSRPIQLDPANEKLFQSHVIVFHKPAQGCYKSVQGCTGKNIIDQQLPDQTNKHEPEFLQRSSVVIFKTKLHNK